MTTRSLSARHAARTDVGRARDHNEDRVLVRPPLYVVADGLGGHSAGEVAAQMLVDRLARLDVAATGADLVAAIEAADVEIREAASAGSGRRGMSTTCVALLLAGDAADVAHVGDSRAYRLRSGRLERLTEDHSVVAELVQAGILTEARAATDDRRHLLTQALGSEPPARVTTTGLSVEAGDRYLLCSDGLSGQVADAAIASLLGEIADPGAAADELVRQANRAGGFDNVSVVIVDVTAAGTPAAEEAPEPVSPPTTDRAPGVAAAILVVLAVALLVGAIVVSIASPKPATPAPSASPLPSVSSVASAAP
jgi:protein phosphatase